MFLHKSCVCTCNLELLTLRLKRSPMTKYNQKLQHYQYVQVVNSQLSIPPYCIWYWVCQFKTKSCGSGHEPPRQNTFTHLIVPTNNVGSWGIMDRRLLSWWRDTLPMLTSSMRILPLHIGIILNKPRAMDDLPLPVRPHMPTWGKYHHDYRLWFIMIKLISHLLIESIQRMNKNYNYFEGGRLRLQWRFSSPIFRVSFHTV